MNTASASFTGARSVVKSSRPHLTLRHQFVKAGLENRDFAALQGRDLGGILVDAGNMVAEIRKTRAGDKPNVSGSDDRYSHHESILQARPWRRIGLLADALWFPNDGLPGAPETGVYP